MKNFPKIFKLRQKINVPRLEGVEKGVNELLDQFELSIGLHKIHLKALSSTSNFITEKKEKRIL